ncbi:hypothetical protein Ade02nite_20680 [Paractinoplanes deccanensis]|uniref:Uncharacterized protein n=1 Tax=Paractinoplanes deccanensis TaxID=113561 RepID=A0ABQ3Y096_9ACTN|nr:hypothetical protein [Actinoplanes deccanensis]GID73427.1 hypothetical protein Ade02nite_20680 [Actinoplanes deccanensis]
MDALSPWGEIGRTVRYALVSNTRTARLIALMLIVMIGWYVLL